MSRLPMLKIALFVLLFCSTAGAQVVINEFMASNKATLGDEDGDYSDWVELHNPTAGVVSINNWYLTDSANNLTKWRFPNVSIPANGYLVIFASNKNRRVAGQPLHTSWALSAGGEYLGLVQADGQTIVSEISPSFPEQYEDISYGLLNGTNVYFGTPTPGAPNSANAIAFVADTKFSHNRGFYTNAFNLVITSQTTNALIRYTTNGSPPTVSNGYTYTAPLPINRTTVVRAAAFRIGFHPSNVDTHSYIFLDDVLTQSASSALASGFPATWGTNRVDYGMDPRIVTNAAYSVTIRDDLLSLPTVSLVMKMEDLFNSSTGIYANAGMKGDEWEKPASVEMIQPDGTAGFQVEAGVRIRGGFSRSGSNPKHSFRLFFRKEYGDSKLTYPLFGDKGTDTFDGFDLPTPQNWTWHIHAAVGAGTSGLYLRDHFSRDTQLAMGHQAERGIYAHLYINGQYWGLYSPSERTEASYAASYYGGTKEDYDVVKATGSPGNTIEATDGDLESWTRLWQAATSGFATDAAYQRVQGRNPDGSRNPDYEVLLDVDNLIDYMLLMFYSGSRDAPVTHSGDPYNFFAIRNRNGSTGFQFFVHDFEHTLLSVTENRTGLSTPSTLDKSSPYYFWLRLRSNAEFRMRFADRVHRHFFNDGVLTPAKALERFRNRTNELHRALVAESARWGDAQVSSPYTRNGSWMPLVNNLITNYFPLRTGIVLNQLTNISLYPTVVAPAFNQHGGNVEEGFTVSISAPAGSIYYTLDGTDPRVPGGAIAPTAVLYAGPVQLFENGTLKARVLSGNTWSALNEAPFVIIRDFDDIMITEIMYHPPDNGLVDGNEFEFIELKNVGSGPRDISGVYFSSGIQFTFPNGTVLDPGNFVVLVSNPTEFASKYPGVEIGGVYSGRLSNAGEQITLRHAAGAQIVSLTYSDSAPWPGAADGGGFSLVPRNANLNPDPGNAIHWRASANVGGSPEADDPTPNVPGVVINEILSHTDLPLRDAVELHNPTASDADVSYWFITDQRTDPFKFRIPANTIIPAGGYVVFTDVHFNSGAPGSFLFSSHGEEVYLFSANSSSNLTGYSDGFTFGAAANGVSFGRHIISTGEAKYPAQVQNTLGSANAGPRVGPVVINEIRYRPLPGEQQFVELKNITGGVVKLYDPAYPTNRWSVNGLGFTFPPNTEMAANGLLLLVSGDPVQFRVQHNVPAAVPVFGPWSGVLQNNGELLSLQHPDAPDLDASNNVIVPYITVDDVRYSDRSPWPDAAASAGSSLERINPAVYGNDPINWKARVHGATPGYENDRNLPPYVAVETPMNVSSSVYPFDLALSSVIVDDGPDANLTIQWSQLSGPASVSFTAANASQTSARFPMAGVYQLQISVVDGVFETNAVVVVTLQRPSYPMTLIASNSVWRYLDNGSEQGIAWKASGFDDSTWNTGVGKFGYGEGNEGTVISFGPNSSNKYITSYYRHAFTVVDRNSVTALAIKLLRDDGAVVYLNGTEVLRSNMPGGSVNYTTLASSVVGGADESTYFESVMSPGLLVNGTNVIAVELHQANATGTDAGFDLELSGEGYAPNQAPTVSAGTNMTIRLPGNAFLQGAVFDDGLPLSPGVPSLLWAKTGGSGSVEFSSATSALTVAQFLQQGSYTLRLNAFDGALNGWGEVSVDVLPETYASWIADQFSEAQLADPLVSGASADPDGDGFTNAQEFTAGSNPLDETSYLRFSGIAREPGEGQVRLTIHAAARRSYSIQRTSHLASEWITIREIPAELQSRQVEVVEEAQGTGYYRIVVGQ